MSDRRRPVLRTALGKVAITGAASLAAVFAMAPLAASAADEPAPETSEPTPTDTTVPTPTVPAPSETIPTETAPSSPGAGTKYRAPSSEDGQAKAAEVDPLVADFGQQKYRVGVQIADGSYVPAGTTTVGSVIRITETGPDVVDAEGDPVPSLTFTCTTQASTVEEGSTASYCINPDSIATRRAEPKAPVGAAAVTVAKGGVEVDPDEDFARFDQLYTARAGSTVTFSQVSAANNKLVKTAETATIKPCEAISDEELYCSGNFFGLQLSTVMFSNPGLPPVARDDSETTDPGEPVDIEILDNDDTVNGAPLTGIKVVSDPSDGKVKIIGSVDEPVIDEPEGEVPGGEEPTVAGAIGTASVRVAAVPGGPVFRYTPKAGFTGKDTFDYTITTQNGTATATVTIRVRDDGTSGEGEDGDGVLPDTGGSDLMLLAYGGALLGGGGWLIVVGRRRVLGRHALVD